VGELVPAIYASLVLRQMAGTRLAMTKNQISYPRFPITVKKL